MAPQLSTAPSETYLLTPCDVAQRLRFSPRTILEWLRAGALPGAKIGNRWRITEQDLEQFIADERDHRWE